MWLSNFPQVIQLVSSRSGNPNRQFGPLWYSNPCSQTIYSKRNIVKFLICYMSTLMFWGNGMKEEKKQFFLIKSFKT